MPSGRHPTPVERSWSSTDCLLYALGIGAGSLDAADFELEYTTENSTDRPQKVLAHVRGGAWAGAARRAPRWARSTWPCWCTGSSRSSCSVPSRAQATVRTTSTVTGIYDKGSGALVVSESTSVDCDSGEPRCTATTSLFIRGEGGFGGDRGPSSGLEPWPGREPDDVVTLHHATRPGAAVPAFGRPQPFALRSRLRQARGVRSAHPARVVHLRLHRSGAAPHGVRFGSGPLSFHGGALLAADVSR